MNLPMPDNYKFLFLNKALLLCLEIIKAIVYVFIKSVIKLIYQSHIQSQTKFKEILE